MLDTINSSLSFWSNMFQMYPNQNGTADMVSDNSGFATLTPFQSGKLLGFSVKLLNLPTQAAHFLYRLGIILSQVVCYHIVRALDGQHNPEQFHFVLFGKALDLHDFAALLFFFGPFQRIHSAIGQSAARIIYLTIVFEWAVIYLLQRFFNKEHHILRRIPAIHQHSIECNPLLVHTIGQHLMQMIQLRLAISIGIVDPIINNPKLVRRWVDIHTSHYTDPFDHATCIPAILSLNQLNLVRIVLVNHRIVKHDISVGILHHSSFHVFPNQVRCNLISGQVSIDHIVSEYFSVLCKVRQRIVDLATEQILAVVQASNGLFRWFNYLENIW